jgi:hypothetical protein
MSEEILAGPVNVTDRAHALGWKTTGLTVRAHLIPDEDASPYDDGFSPIQASGWLRGMWWYVGLVVTVTDAYGFDWSTDSLFSVVRGWWTSTDENGVVTGERWLDPLTEDDPLNEVIGTALRNAVQRIKSFIPPKIMEPSA